MSLEEDRTRDTVDSEPKHYQLSYSGPPYSDIKPDIKNGSSSAGSVLGSLSCVMQRCGFNPALSLR